VLDFCSDLLLSLSPLGSYPPGLVDSLAGCTAYSNHLWVSSSDGSITNLDSLSALTYVNGGLRLDTYQDRNPFTITDLSVMSNITFHPNKAMVVIDGLAQLESLDGLEKVVQASTIEITNNAKLADISSLRNVLGTVSQITFKDNDVLRTLEPLSGISAVSSTVEVCGSPTVVSALGLHNISPDSPANVGIQIDDRECGNRCTNTDGSRRTDGGGSWSDMGCVHDTLIGSFGYPDCFGGIVETAAQLQSFENCTSIQTALHIRNIDAAQVVNMSALSQVRSINGANGFGESLVIDNVANLVDFKDVFLSLQGALSLAGALVIKNNADLVSLEGLEALGRIDGMESRSGELRSVEITQNLKLVSVRGLDGLNGTLPGKLLVTGNPLLECSSFGHLALGGAQSAFVTSGLTTCYAFPCVSSLITSSNCASGQFPEYTPSGAFCVPCTPGFGSRGRTSLVRRALLATSR
jgi:hypothetical protein